LPPRSLISVRDAELKVAAYVDGNRVEHTRLMLVTSDDVFVYDEDLRSAGATKAAGWLEDLVKKEVHGNGKQPAKPAKKGKRSAKKGSQKGKAARPSRARSV